MAADILQDTFISYYRMLQKREAPENTRAYLFKIARNYWIKSFQKSQPQTALESAATMIQELPAQTNTEAGVEQMEVRRAVGKCVETTLTGMEREVMQYRLYYGFSSVEIATVVQKSDRHIRRLLKSGGAALRRCMEKKGWDMGDITR